MHSEFSAVSSIPFTRKPARWNLGREHIHRVSKSENWRVRYSHRLRLLDVVAVVLSVSVAHVTRFGTGNHAGFVADSVVLTTCLAIGWLLMLSIFRTRSSRLAGSDIEEYRRIVSATGALFGSVAVVSFIFDLQLSRGYLALALSGGLVSIMLGRVVGRRFLAAQRRVGRCVTTVVVVGSPAAAAAMAISFERDPRCGFRVAGVCVPGSDSEVDFGESGERIIEVLGDETCVLAAVHSTGADFVVVTATEKLGDRGMRSLLWTLANVGVGLVVSLGVADVARRRLTMRPVANLPLMHVEKPAFSGAARFGKTSFDVCFALTAVVLLLPLLLAVALGVKATSSGPILYRSERIGLSNRPFQMLKFRTMVDGADAMTADLMAVNDSVGGVLFKMKRDPRVTAFGKALRKSSIDELPQFFNVLLRQMSVVGPRPPLRREVECYDDEVSRRMLVKPGITGLWQVSGRSNLSWEDTARLDQSYVENWSMAGDIAIVGRTAKAVLLGTGAY